MSQRWTFDDQDAFLERLRALVDEGVPPERLRVLLPVHVHEVDEILQLRPSPLRLFTLAGAVSGLAIGFAFPILTVLDWPLITGGKPLVSIPPFVVIAFALTILLGGLASFAGFLHLSRLPAPAKIRAPEEHGNEFVIIALDAPAPRSAEHGA